MHFFIFALETLFRLFLFTTVGVGVLEVDAVPDVVVGVPVAMVVGVSGNVVNVVAAVAVVVSVVVTVVVVIIGNVAVVVVIQGGVGVGGGGGDSCGGERLLV